MIGANSASNTPGGAGVPQLQQHLRSCHSVIMTHTSCPWPRSIAVDFLAVALASCFLNVSGSSLCYAERITRRPMMESAQAIPEDSGTWPCGDQLHCQSLGQPSPKPTDTSFKLLSQLFNLFRICRRFPDLGHHCRASFSKRCGTWPWQRRCCQNRSCLDETVPKLSSAGWKLHCCHLGFELDILWFQRVSCWLCCCCCFFFQGHPPSGHECNQVDIDRDATHFHQAWCRKSL